MNQIGSSKLAGKLQLDLEPDDIIYCTQPYDDHHEVTATLYVEGGSSDDQENPPTEGIQYKVATNGIIDFSNVAGEPREQQTRSNRGKKQRKSSMIIPDETEFANF